MGFLNNLIGKTKQLVKGPLRSIVESKAKGVLERFTKSAFKRLPHHRLSQEALAALQSTLQIQLPEFGAQLVGAGLSKAADAVGDRVDQALA